MLVFILYVLPLLITVVLGNLFDKLDGTLTVKTALFNTGLAFIPLINIFCAGILVWLLWTKNISQLPVIENFLNKKL